MTLPTLGELLDDDREPTLANALVDWIEEYWGDRPHTDKAVIGASVVGDDCQAYLSFKLRGFPTRGFPARVLRIFELGHKIEDIVAADLVKALLHKPEEGMEFVAFDPSTGEQFRAKQRGGHVRMRADGILKTPTEKVLIEIKSMGSKKFAEMRKKGIQKSHPKYWHQCQLMMGAFGMERAILLAYCKDTSEYEAEEIFFNEVDYEWLQACIDIAMSNYARRVSDKPDGWRCRFCDYKPACWEGEQHDPVPEIPRLCRTCKHAEAQKDGKWFCTLHSLRCDKPCDDWERYRPLPK